MEKDKNNVYKIFINNTQFTCLFLENKEMEIKIPEIIELHDLEYIEEEKDNDNSISMYYRLKKISKIKIYLNKEFKQEKGYPLSIKLDRLRQLLIADLNDNFCFTFNGSLIQRKEENLFSLKNVIEKDALNLTIPDFDFKNDKENKNFKNDKKNLNKNSPKSNIKEKINDIDDKANNNKVKIEEKITVNDNEIIKKNSGEIKGDNNDKINKKKKNKVDKENKNKVEKENKVNEDNNDKVKKVNNNKMNEDNNDDVNNENKNKVNKQNHKKINKNKNSDNENNDEINIENEEKSVTKKISENINNKTNENICNNNENNDGNSHKRGEIKNNEDDLLKNEIEYEIKNNDILICKIALSPEITLSELREKILDLIPRRSLFLKNEKAIDPSKEDSFDIKQIAVQKVIYIEAPNEDKYETMEIEIKKDGKTYIKKDYYLGVKLKSIRNNLKIDSSYKIIFKGKPLELEEENNITLDEYCYKELKVSFFNVKNNDFTNNVQKLNNIILEKKIYNNTFKNNDNFETWIFLGKEKGGKTTFINCLVNYCLGVRFEDKFRYIFKENYKNGYVKYDINGNSPSTKIRIYEFPGFSGIPEEDNSNIQKIEKFLKNIDKIKIICFVINEDETRLTDEIKVIFSTVLSLFGYDIKNNFIFLITKCDAKNPPVLDCIRSSIFSKILKQLPEPWFYKFNNSYLFETIQKDFWDIGNSNFKILIDNLSKKNNNSLEVTKQYINLKNSYEENKNNFMTSLIKLQNIKFYINLLNKIYYYSNSNTAIPFQYMEEFTLCTNCNNIIKHSYCKNGCPYDKIIIQKVKHEKISLKDLKNNNNLYQNCLSMYNNYYKNELITISDFYFQLKEYYKLQLIRNDFLQDDLKTTIDENKYKEFKKEELLSLLKNVENLFSRFKTKGNKENIKNFINSLNPEEF